MSETTGPAWGAPITPSGRSPERARPARPDPRPTLTRQQRRSVRIVERVSGRRIHNRVGTWRRVRSLLVLLLLGAVLAAVLAAILASIVAGLALAFHHVSGN